MRTTLNLDDDMLHAVRALAKERGESLGAVVSSLLRRALRSDVRIAYEADIPVFIVREDAPPITPEMVQSAMEEP